MGGRPLRIADAAQSLRAGNAKAAASHKEKPAGRAPGACTIASYARPLVYALIGMEQAMIRPDLIIF